MACFSALYTKLPKLTTRILKSFKGVAGTGEEIATAVSIANKIKSSGSKKKSETQYTSLNLRYSPKHLFLPQNFHLPP